jgi:hypothetical protein
MSRTTQSTTLRTLALASALLAAGLAAPAAGHAQSVTQERTLLNRIAIPSIASAKSDAARTAPTDPGIPGSVEGARALLGQTPSRERHELDREPIAVAAPAKAQLDGERALLGRWPPAEARRLGHRAQEEVRG